MDPFRENENDFSFWYPKVKDCGIRTPRTFFAKLPTHEEEPIFARKLYEAFYMESPRENMSVIQAWLDRDIIPKLEEMKLTGHVFVKNARFSNKFSAKGNCNLYGLNELARAIASINYEAMCCEADGIDEIVVRAFIDSDRKKTPCIYEGLPLRSEFRVFYDFDSKAPIFTANYWDFDYVYPHLHDATDRIVFAHEKESISANFFVHRNGIQGLVADAMQAVEGLTGQWSVDVLLDEKGQPWLIDMALAQRSAYWELRPDKNAYQ